MSSSKIKATVLIPTTKDRAPLLPYSIGSICNQTIRDIEIFVIGDGVDDITRQVIIDLKSKDDRIILFDHPKHKRRGEPYRHSAILNHAKGDIICYLLDRDLMMPNHVETMLDNLKDYNFCVNTLIGIEEDGTRLFKRKPFYGTYIKSDHPNKSKSIIPYGTYLSPVAHTIEFYKQLPFGWRTTPVKYYTDQYMWNQFITNDNLRLISTTEVSALYFKRGNHPGKPATERANEILPYFEKLNDEKFLYDIKEDAIAEIILEREYFIKSPLLLKGTQLLDLPKKILEVWYNRFGKKK